MEKQRKKQAADVGFHVERMRRLYSQIGEPLPVDIIIDLHHHLGGTLEAYAETEYAPRRKKQKVCGRPN